MGGWLGGSWPKEKKVTFVNGVRVIITAPARLENADDPDVRFAYLFCGSIGTLESAEATGKRGQQKAIFTAVAIPDEMAMLSPWTQVISGLSNVELAVTIDPGDGSCNGRMLLSEGLMHEDEELDVRFVDIGMIVRYGWISGGRQLCLYAELPVSVNQYTLSGWLKVAREKVRKANELYAEIIALGVVVRE